MSWRADAKRLLTALEETAGQRERLVAASALLLGARYRGNPLRGGPEKPERLVLALTSFDCVTFVEAALALALSRSAQEYRARLIEIRYGGRPPRWEHRLHIWSHWLAAHERRGLLQTVDPARDATDTVRVLTLVPGIPRASVRLRLHPWSGAIPAADLVAFASVRDDLDVYHAGLLAGPLLRHASRAEGGVIEEPLAAFLSRERGAGLLLARLRGGVDWRS
ncbi:MAG: DUF1460 domain-containing protein [Candidatus Eisenbacteria bacterium]|jgi:hypothetical protein|nr:DUF1460 domain-containing protein [Candidatus Eisenbacteria bacterium]